MLKNLSIKLRLILVSGVSIFGSLAIIFLINYTMETQKELALAEKKVVEIRNYVLTLRKHEKDFLARKDVKYLGKFDKDEKTALKVIDELDEILRYYDIPTEKQKMYKVALKEYRTAFHRMVDIQKKIGVDSKSGLHGDLRATIHKAETMFKDENNYRLLKDMLMLRRNEKDFFQRLDLKYKGKFEKNYKILVEDIKNSSMNDERKERALSLSAAYKKDFFRVIDAYNEKGFDEKSGVHGEMRSAVHKTKTLYKEIKKDVSIALQEQVDTLINALILKVALISGVIVLLVFVISGSIIRPIKRLGKITKDLSSGEGDLTKRITIDTKDELSVVVSDINAFLEKLQNTIGETKLSSSENASVAEELSATSQTIGKRVEEATAIVDKTTEATKEIEKMVTSSLNDSMRAKEDIEKANAKIEAVEDDIRELVSEIEASSSVEYEMAEKLRSLSEDAEQVKGVLTVISDIAEQTNLLALNAAIEAARAGEHGRGFAVVADEVRKLAERTQKSLSEINATVNVIVQNVIDSSTEMTSNSETIQRLVDSSTKVMGEIGDSKILMEQAITIARQSREDSEIISTKIGDLSREITSVNDISFSNSRSVEEIATASEHLSNLSFSLNEKLKSFRT